MSENKGGPDYIFEKTQEIKRIKNKKAFNKKLIVLLFVISFLLIIAFYLNSDLSKIRYININGNNLLTESEILNEININEGDFRFSINKKEIKERISNLTLIKDSIINVDIYGNLNIYIDEKRPLMYWTKDNKVQVLFDDKSIYEIEGTIGFKWLLNIPMIIGINEEMILSDLFESYVLLDKNIVNNIIRIELYPLSYDDKNIVLYFKDENYVLCNMSKINKANDYYSIITKLKVNNSCIFFDSYSNNGYSSNCPWEIVEEEIVETDDIIEEKE